MSKKLAKHRTSKAQKSAPTPDKEQQKASDRKVRRKKSADRSDDTGSGSSSSE